VTEKARVCSYVVGFFGKVLKKEGEMKRDIRDNSPTLRPKQQKAKMLVTDM